MDLNAILQELHSYKGRDWAIKGRKLAKQVGTNHELALRIWRQARDFETDSRNRSLSRWFASQIADPAQATPALMDEWVSDFEWWGDVDAICNYFFWKLPWAYEKCFEYSERSEEFVKRTAFALMATLAMRHKTMLDAGFEGFYPVIVREAYDMRRWVTRAVDWALRQIGKRNRVLNKSAIKVAKQLTQIESGMSERVGRRALKELTSEKIQKRLREPAA